MKAITFAVIGFFLFLFVGIPMISKIIEDSEDMQGRCEGFGYMDTPYKCCEDCQNLDMSYVKGKYVDTGFLSDSDYQCTCINNNSKIIKLY